VRFSVDCKMDISTSRHRLKKTNLTRRGESRSGLIKGNQPLHLKIVIVKRQVS
jgi:hypothetical protein